jgi:hypothetical protein
MIRGAAIMARAIATICCSPPLKVEASWRRRSRRIGNCSNCRSIAPAMLRGP